MALCLATCPDYAASPSVLAVLVYNPAVDITALKGGGSVPPAGTDPVAISPLRHLDASIPPVLIQHGTADQFFPIEVMRRFRDAAAGCELIEYAGATHAFFNRRISEEHFEATTAAAIGFLSRVAHRQST